MKKREAKWSTWGRGTGLSRLNTQLKKKTRTVTKLLLQEQKGKGRENAPKSESQQQIKT